MCVDLGVREREINEKCRRKKMRIGAFFSRLVEGGALIHCWEQKVVAQMQDENNGSGKMK